MRVCIVADSASVRFGGEAILPYQYFRLLSQRGVDVWLVVHDRTRPELLKSFPELQGRILYSPDSWLHRALSYFVEHLPRRIYESTLGLASFLLTQHHQREMVRTLVEREGIDVIHQPSPVSPRVPSLMFGLGAPVIIGPLNGGMHYPTAFRGQESSFSHAAIWAGRGLSNLVNQLLPGKLRAATVLVANQRTRMALPHGIQGHIVEVVENAVDLDTWVPKLPIPLHLTQCNQFIFLGRLVDWKRLDIALRALARVPGPTLLVIGDGEMRVAWERLSRELQLADRVSFLGWKPHEECASYLAESIALVLPSVYECGGAVVLESMASARPVIATRWGGPVDYLDESCGLLVDPRGDAEMIDDFAAAMVLLCTQPEIADRMGMAGRQRAQERFTWRHKIDLMEEIYSEAIQSVDHLSMATSL